MEEIKSEKGNESFVGRTFAVCLAAAALLNIFHPAKELTEDAMSLPIRFSWETVASGTFAEDKESRFSDRLFGKNVLAKLRTALRQFGGSKKENGVFTGKSGQLLADIEMPDEDKLNENISAMMAFAGRYTDVAMTVILVPDAANILKDKLPRLAVTHDQDALMGIVRKDIDDRLRWVDAAKALTEHKEEKIYYKTDHRWTGAGAFYVFQEAAGTLGIEEDVASMFASYTVAADFNGDLAKISGVKTGEKERIDIYVPKDRDNDVTVNYTDGAARRTSLYVSEKLKTKDKYDVFLGGDCALADIKTMSERKNRLLIIKDSFANCFIPFLAPFYREIVAIDPLYFSGGVDDIMDMYGITDVIFLCGGNTFFTDNNLSGVLKIGRQDEGRIPFEDGAGEAE